MRLSFFTKSIVIGLIVLSATSSVYAEDAPKAIYPGQESPKDKAIAELFNKKDEDALVRMVAIDLIRKGRYQKAEEFLVKLLKKKEDKSGKDSIDLIPALNDLSLLYVKAGNIDKALKIVKRKKEIQEKALGKAHKDTVSTIAVLGNIYQKMQKYDLALSSYQEAAQNGSVSAYYYMAILYGQGLGVERDVKKCFELIEKAADGGFAPALTHMAVVYTNGIEGFSVDQKKAFDYAKRAADLGDIKGQMLVSTFYSEGKGVEKDINKSIFYVEKAVKSGALNMIHILGLLYMEQGDIAKAYACFEKGAAGGNKASVEMKAKIDMDKSITVEESSKGREFLKTLLTKKRNKQ